MPARGPIDSRLPGDAFKLSGPAASRDSSLASGSSGAGAIGVLDPSQASADHADALRAWLSLQASLHLEPVRAVELLRRTGDPRAALRLARRVPPLDRRQL